VWKNLRSNRKSAHPSKLLPSNYSATDFNLILPLSDEVVQNIAARRGATQRHACRKTPLFLCDHSVAAAPRCGLDASAQSAFLGPRRQDGGLMSAATLDYAL